MPVVLLPTDGVADRVQYKVPKKGPADPNLYLCCGGILGADRAFVANDAVWLEDDSMLVRAEISLDEIDQLVALGWVDLSRAVDAIDVTSKGQYWVGLFVKVNSDRFAKRQPRGWNKFMRRTFGAK